MTLYWKAKDQAGLNRLYSSADDGTGAAQFLDGRDAGGVPGMGDVTLTYNFGGKLLFIAGRNVNGSYVHDLYVTTGTVGGTTRLGTYNSASYLGLEGGKVVVGEAGGKVFFLTPNAQSKTELWTTDGTVAAPRWPEC